MAGGQGAAAYSQLQKPDSSLSQSQQFWAGKAMQKVSEEKSREFAKEQKKAEWDRKDIDTFYEGEKDLSFNYSGQKTLDDVVFNQAEHITEKYTDYGELYEEAIKKGDRVTARKIASKKNKMLRNFNTSKEQIKTMSAKMNDFKEMVSNGQISDMDDRSYNAFGAIEDYDITSYTDENDNIRYKMKVEDENGKLIEKDFDMNEFDNGWLDPIKKIKLSGKNGIVNQFLESIGKKKRYKEDGNWVIIDDSWTSQDESAIRAEVKALTGNDRAMADLLYQASGNRIKKYDNFTEADKKMVEDYVYNLVQVGRSSDTTKKTNYQKLNYERSLRADARAEKTLSADEKKKKDAKVKAVATPVVTPSGDVEVTTYKAPKQEGKAGFRTKTFNLNRKDDKNITGIFDNKQLILESVEMDEDGNFWGNTSLPTSTRVGSTAKGGTAQSYNTYEKGRRKLNNKDLTNIATLLGYGSTKELSDELTSMSGESTAKTANKEDIGILD